MNTVVSPDGTTIGFDRIGEGPPLILVDGALCYRKLGPSGPLAAQLAPHFTVYTYDRRGRGESTDQAPSSVEREVEDIASLIDEAGGSASVYGISSGAVLAIEAANRGLPVKKLAVYEAPFIVDDTRTPLPEDFMAQLTGRLATGDRAGAVRLFMRAVGAPAVVVALMRFAPAWSKLTAVAHTLPYDMSMVVPYQRGQPLPARQWSSVTAPTLVIGGGKSDVWMRHAVEALADTLPNAELRTLDGQTHMVKAKAHAPTLVDFFAS